MKVDVDSLIRACSDDAYDAGISMPALLEPIAGVGAPVKPAIYSGPSYQEDQRWWGDPLQPTRVIVLDNVPSQANRLEAALVRMREELGIPEIRLDLSAVPGLPPHVPKSISSLQFPHRQADAYLRDADLDGRPFLKTPIGQALFTATADDARALYQWFPQALLFGFWQSHLGKKRSQAKLARSWVSEIIGIAPAVSGDRTKVLGLKGDPLNLSVDERATFNADDLFQPWTLEQGSTRATKGGKGERLSQVGHGQVPVGGALAPVSFRAIEQSTAVSFASLRRISGGDPSVSAIGRALLVAIGIAGHAAAFGASFSLRSGCDLRAIRSSWKWIGAAGDEETEPIGLDAAIELLRRCRERADSAGLLSGGGWGQSPRIVTPNEGLRKAIAATWTVPD